MQIFAPAELPPETRMEEPTPHIPNVVVERQPREEREPRGPPKQAAARGGAQGKRAEAARRAAEREAGRDSTPLAESAGLAATTRVAWQALTLTLTVTLNLNLNLTLTPN